MSGLLNRETLPILLGGDDCIPIPFLQAFVRHGPVAILHVDAHLDYHEERDGERLGFSSAMRRAAEMPWVSRICHVGLRGVGSALVGDVADARAHGDLLITASHLRKEGPSPVLEYLGGMRFVVSLVIGVAARAG